MIEFYEQNQLLVFGLLAVLVVLLLFVFLRKPKKAETVRPKEESQLPKQVNVTNEKVSPEAEPAKVVETKPQVEPTKEPVKPEVIKPAKPEVAPKPMVEAVSKPTAPVVIEPEDEAEGDDDPTKDVLSKDKPAKYHVSQNKDEKNPNFKKWRVRKEGSTKTIKYLETQKEAIEYATNLAEKAGSTIVIHKVDGSIRKQDYTKK